MTAAFLSVDGAIDLFLRRWQAHAEEAPHKLLCVERKDGIDITLSADGPVGSDQHENQHGTAHQSPKTKRRRQTDEDNAHEFQGKSHLQTDLCVVGNRHKRHIQHDF